MGGMGAVMGGAEDVIRREFDLWRPVGEMALRCGRCLVVRVFDRMDLEEAVAAAIAQGWDTSPPGVGNELGSPRILCPVCLGKGKKRKSKT